MAGRVSPPVSRAPPWAETWLGCFRPSTLVETYTYLLRPQLIPRAPSLPSLIAPEPVLSTNARAKFLLRGTLIARRRAVHQCEGEMRESRPGVSAQPCCPPMRGRNCIPYRGICPSAVLSTNARAKSVPGRDGHIRQRAVHQCEGEIRHRPPLPMAWCECCPPMRGRNYRLRRADRAGQQCCPPMRGRNYSTRYLKNASAGAVHQCEGEIRHRPPGGWPGACCPPMRGRNEPTARCTARAGVLSTNARAKWPRDRRWQHRPARAVHQCEGEIANSSSHSPSKARPGGQRHPLSRCDSVSRVTKV